jgi:hypothetical protein
VVDGIRRASGNALALTEQEQHKSLSRTCCRFAQRRKEKFTSVCAYSHITA